MRRAAILLVAPVLAVSLAAHATVDGKWRQGALHEQYTIQQWLSGCGPAPVSGDFGGGDVVTIRAEGDELVFAGGGRTYRTDQCYDQMPTLARDTHSRDPAKSWRTKCSTPAGDPRRALIQTLVSITSDTRIDVIETGRYEVTLKDGRCVADIKRQRTFTRIAEESAAPPPAPAPQPEPVAKEPPPVETPPLHCGSPGRPARLEVRPSRKLLRPGESFAFRGSVFDAAGCPTRTPITWASADNRVVVDPSGRVTVGEQASDGVIDLVATAKGRSAKVTVEIASAAKYDELLAQTRAESDAPSVATIATESIGAGEARVDSSGAERRRLTFVVLISTVVLALGATWLVLSMRAKRRRALRFHDLEPMSSPEPMPPSASAPLPEVPVPSPTPTTKRGKICPTCGGKFDGSAAFCGKDGTALVLIN